MNDIEKCAKLMGFDYYGKAVGKVYRTGVSGYDQEPVEFNPVTNKSDLMDLECSLVIDVAFDEKRNDVIASRERYNCFSAYKYVSDDAKFTARAHAVVAVAVQIYDRTNP